MNKSDPSDVVSPVFKWVYLVTLGALLFSGFGQMPIFKRYYLADLPGMAWTADFYVTLIIHYIAAAVFIGLSVYYLAYYAREKNWWAGLNGRAWLRGFLFVVLIMSGVLLVVRNLPWIAMPQPLAIVATLTHTGATMVFLVAAATYLRWGQKQKKPLGGFTNRHAGAPTRHNEA